MNMILALLWIGLWFTPPLILAHRVWTKREWDRWLSTVIGLNE